MRLAPKVFLVSALVILVLGGVAGWSLHAVNELVEVNRGIATRSVPAIEATSGLPESFRRLVRLEAKYFVLRDRAYADLWNERATRISSELDRLGTLLVTDEEKHWHADAVAAFTRYRTLVEQERVLLTRGETARAERISSRDAREAADHAEASVVKLMAATNAALRRAQAEAGALAGRTWNAVVWALVGSLGAALAATGFLAFRMTRALRRLSRATRDLADGSFTEPLPTNRKDEIGDLARAFNRMAVRLKEVDTLKEEFFSHISHDLRNPLTGMRGAAQLLVQGRTGPLQERQMKMVGVIAESAERMLAMVNQILEFTRLRAHLMPLERRPVDLAKVVARALDEVHPQAEDAGYLTARALIERGKRERAFGPDGKLHMLAIAGDRSTPSSIKRNQGMRRAVAEDPRVALEQEVYAAWTREKAAEQADWLYQRYPDAKLAWAGNDLMAFGAMTAWEKRAGKPGVDAWFSGINTSTEALEAVKSGRLTALAGGHFITGAWALVMIYDYHHGRDFADEGLELQRPMFAEFTPQLADRYIERFSGGFDAVDFTRYSKVKNPRLRRYNFGFAQLLEPQN